MGLTRMELQNLWKSSTDNNNFKNAIVTYGPRVAFGQFRDFVLEVRNDFRPDLVDLLDQWKITVATLRANCNVYNITIGPPSDRLIGWINQSYHAGMSRTWCMSNFRVGPPVLNKIIGKNSPQQQISLTHAELKTFFMQRVTLSDIAARLGVSKFSLSKYLKTNKWAFDLSLLRSDIETMCKDGVRLSIMADRLGVSYITIKTFMIRSTISYSSEHLKMFKQQDAADRKLAGKVGSQVTTVRSQQLMQRHFPVVQLFKNGQSVKAISKDVGLAQGTIKKILQYYNVNILTKQQYLDGLSERSMEKWLSVPARMGYDYSDVSLAHWKSDNIPITCPTHGKFIQNWVNHFSLGANCPKCSLNGTPSKPEQEVYNFILSLGVVAEQSNRAVLGGKELDIFVESHNLAIEFNGLFWHSSDDIHNLRKRRHVEKSEMCEQKSIQLLHIQSDEWADSTKQLIWKSMIRARLGKIDQKISARKTVVTSLSHVDTRKFLEENHLQGSVRGTNIALQYRGDVVAILVYGKSRFEKNKIEILRMCTKRDMIVVGGMTKLISQLRNAVDQEIISYANRRWSRGNVYRVSGFTQESITPPNYWYVKNGTSVLSRYQCQKHKLGQLLKELHRPDMTEMQNMLAAGYRVIFDCGNFKFSLT